MSTTLLLILGCIYLGAWLHAALSDVLPPAVQTVRLEVAYRRPAYKGDDR